MSLSKLVLFTSFLLVITSFHIPLQKVKSKGRIRTGLTSNTTNVTLTDLDGWIFIGNVTLGTPAKIFTMIWDTGSAGMFVPGPKVNAFNHYVCSESSTCNDTGKIQDMQYGVGNIVGFIIYDNMGVGTLVSENQRFVQAYKVLTPPVDFSTTDGFMGMSMTQYKTGQYSDFVENLWVTSVIAERTFSMNLKFANNYNSETPNDGSVFMGGYDPTLLQDGEQFVYLPLSNPNSWMIDLEGASIGNQSLNTGTGILIDSGTSFFLVDTTTFNSVISYLNDTFGCPGNNGYPLCNCNSTSDFPSFNFTSNGMIFSVPSEYWTQLQPNGTCMVTLYGMDFGFWIAGVPFFENYFVHFTMDNQTIGFAGEIIKAEKTNDIGVVDM